MRYFKHRAEWWVDPGLPYNKPRVPKRLLHENPVNSAEELPRRLLGKIGAFAPSRKWAQYKDIGGIDAGYIAPLYSMKELGKRYGLSQNGRIYFKKHILPEPFDIVRRRSVAAHHWSRFTLMALDEVLLDLERLGYTQFLKSFVGHIDNLHDGVEWMEAHYGEKYELQPPDLGDDFGVTWY